ncbi:unnamed protein product [Boreogadus saida]
MNYLAGSMAPFLLSGRVSVTARHASRGDTLKRTREFGPSGRLINPNGKDIYRDLNGNQRGVSSLPSFTMPLTKVERGDKWCWWGAERFTGSAMMNCPSPE